MTSNVGRSSYKFADVQRLFVDTHAALTLKQAHSSYPETEAPAEALAGASAPRIAAGAEGKNAPQPKLLDSPAVAAHHVAAETAFPFLGKVLPGPLNF